MKEALQGGKDQFVSIFLDCGVELKTFLNRETLDVLCKVGAHLAVLTTINKFNLKFC